MVRAVVIALLGFACLWGGLPALMLAVTVSTSELLSDAAFGVSCTSMRVPTSNLFCSSSAGRSLACFISPGSSSIDFICSRHAHFAARRGLLNLTRTRWWATTIPSSSR